MNFDSLEGLTDADINQLYFDEEKLVEWYGTFCKTVYADENSNCVSFFTRYAHNGHCALDCANSITFTEEAMKLKCAELCGGGTEIALEANVHKNAHSATYVNREDTTYHYCHGIGTIGTWGSCGGRYSHRICYSGHYHSCHEAAWNYYGVGVNYYCRTYYTPAKYFHGRHEHPWPIAWNRCQALQR